MQPTSTDRSESISQVQAPLVFGVTGHRDLRPEDIAGLESKVREVFRKFRSDYPSTPFLMLSPLADGADRLVARVALEPEIGARLVCPLPMRREFFEADFSPESLADFHALLARASLVFEIESLAADEAIRQHGEARNRQYEAGGKYIARESQILIALWDGKPSDKVGGTAAIVKFQTEGIAPENDDCDLTPREIFPIFHILTPRLSNPNVDGTPLELRVIYPPAFAKPEDAANYYARTFCNLEEYNRAITEGGEALLAEAAASTGYVTGGFNRGNLSPAESLTLDRYAIADALAIRYQKRERQAHRALHWLVFFSFLFFVLFAHLESHSALMLGLSLVGLGAAYSVHHRAKHFRLDIKSQDYRALAEACRVRFFWQIAGIGRRVADTYLGKQRTELDWIRYALSGWRIEMDGGANRSPFPPSDRLQFIAEHWVKDQAEYFHKSSERSERHFELMERWTTTFLTAAICVAAAVFISAVYVQYTEESLWECPECNWIDVPVILIDAFLAAGALLHHANQRRAHAEHRKQYKRMIDIFKNALRVIERQPDLSAALPCLAKLGQEALEENGDWVLLHRERPLELPHP